MTTGVVDTYQLSDRIQRNKQTETVVSAGKEPSRVARQEPVGALRQRQGEVSVAEAKKTRSQPFNQEAWGEVRGRNTGSGSARNAPKPEQ